jgi:ABC-type phosphate transport system permease subunit
LGAVSGKRQNCISNRISNIITGLILSIGRVSGETAPILFTVAAIFYLNCLLHFRSSDGIALSFICDFTSGTDIENQERWLMVQHLY